MLTNEATRSLLHHLHAERAGHVGLVTIAFDGNVLRLVEPFIGAAAVHTFGILLGAALITANGQSCEMGGGEH